MPLVVPPSGENAMTVAQSARSAAQAAEGHIHSNRCSGLCGPPLVEAAALLPEGTGATISIAEGSYGECIVFAGGSITTPPQSGLGSSEGPARIVWFELGPGTHRVQPSAIIPDWMRRRHPGIDFSGADLMARSYADPLAVVYWRAPSED